MVRRYRRSTLCVRSQIRLIRISGAYRDSTKVASMMPRVSALQIGRLSVKTKVTLMATLLFLIALLLVSSIQLYYVKSEMRTVLAEQQHALVARVADEIDQKLQAHLKLIEANSKVLSPALVENTAELQKWAQERNGLRSLFSDIFVISAKGVVLVDVPARDRRGIDVSDREYFRTTVETRRPYISKPYIGRANKIPQVSFSGPVFDQRGAVVAVVTGSLDLLQPNFLGNLAESKVGEKGFFGLFTRERLLIVSRDRSRIMTQGPAAGESPYFDRAVSGQDGSEEAVNSRGLNAIFSYSQLQAAPWVLVSVLPVDEAYAPIRSAQQHIIIATLFLGLLIAPLVGLAVRRFYDPLRRALGEQEVGLHRAQALAKLSHVITGPDGEFESWPETLPRMIGRQPAEMPRNTREWLETVHPEDREKLRATAIAAGKGNKQLQGEDTAQPGGQFL